MGSSCKAGREEVFQAWYMDDSNEDQRLPHQRDPHEFVSLDKLTELGVMFWRLDADNYETDKELKKIRASRRYSFRDFCLICPDTLPNYVESIKTFFEEHLNAVDEILYCLAGSGYYDVKDHNDVWIRIWMKKGGMIALPAGIYHRFTLDTNNYIMAMQLGVGQPNLSPLKRQFHDRSPVRTKYLEALWRRMNGLPEE